MAFKEEAVITNALKHLNLACVIDHSGRAGNAFFLTTFDQHPEILACPLMHYTYSYLISTFKENSIPSDEAKGFLTNISYFRLLYNAQRSENQHLIRRMGAHDKICINEKKIQQITDDYFATVETITRKELALLPFIIYAVAHKINIELFKYVLVSDAISLREENVNTGYSGKVVDTILEDFPNAKLIHLVRDPRATFASPRHQYVNWLGNMYALKIGNFISRFKDLWTRNLGMDNCCVYLFWLLYLSQSARAIQKKKEKFNASFLTIRNEDLNIQFLDTVSKICEWLNVSIAPKWQNQDFTPTILAKPWLGTGAYNSRYQTVTNGRLKNESENISKAIAGPNSYITERWKKSLNKREVMLIEQLFYDELTSHGYPILYYKPKMSKLGCYLKSALLPFEGELPSVLWIAGGFKAEYKELLNRLYYTACFIPFYMLSRAVLFDYIFRKKFFDNPHTAT